MITINKIANYSRVTCLAILLIIIASTSFSQNPSSLLDSARCTSLLSNSDSLLAINKIDLAIEKARDAYNLASQNEFTSLKLRCKILLGDAYSMQNQVDIGLRHYLSALSIAEELKNRKQICTISKKIGDALFSSQAFEKALEYYQKAYQIKSNKTDEESLSLLEDIALCYQNTKKYPESISAYDSIMILTESNSKLSIRLRSCFNLSEINRNLGNWDKSIDYSQKLYDYFQSCTDQYGMALAMNNIGYNLISKNEYEKSIQAFNNALASAKQSNASNELTLGILTNLGICYQNVFNYKKSREFLNQAVSITDETKDMCKKAYLQNLIALVYYNNKDLYNAHESSKSSIETAEKMKCKDILQECYKTYSIILRDGNDYISALAYYEKYLKIRDSVVFEKRIKEQNLSDQLNLLKETESKQQLFIADQQMKDLQVKQLKLETEQKEQQISLLKKEKELEQSEKNRAIQSLALVQKEHEAALHQSTIIDLQQKNAIKELEIKQKETDRQKEVAILQGQQEKQRLENEKLAEGRKRVIWMLVLSGLILIVVAISFIVTKKKNHLLAEQKKDIQEKNKSLEDANEEIVQQNAILSEQSEEIRAQNEEITVQKDMIEKKNENIMDSIQYARVIQTAILPEDEPLKSVFSDHFILYRPKDVVSGDFWWFEEAGDKFIITVADCTGHGVPGALLSMLGIAYLHEIVSINPIISANDLLFELRKMVVSSLKSSPTRDGMDIALCIFDFKKGVVEISAANNSIYIISNGEINIIKADKMPIGTHPLLDRNYTQNIIEFKKGDKFYLFSDGYADQFGGDEGKKLKMSNFRDILLKSSEVDMTSQKEYLEKELDTWQGLREQVDDILVLGFKI